MLTYEFISISITSHGKKVKMFEVECNEKKLTILQNFHPSAPKYLFGDKFRIRHVLTNVVANAIKFSSKGAAIQISVSASNSPKDIGHGTLYYVSGKKFSSFID